MTHVFSLSWTIAQVRRNHKFSLECAEKAQNTIEVKLLCVVQQSSQLCRCPQLLSHVEVETTQR